MAEYQLVTHAEVSGSQGIEVIHAGDNCIGVLVNGKVTDSDTIQGTCSTCGRYVEISAPSSRMLTLVREL